MVLLLRRTYIVALATLLAAITLPLARCLAVEPADVTVDVRPDRVIIRTGAAEATVRRARYRLALHDLGRGRRLVREVAHGGLFYERGATTHALGRVTAVTSLVDGVLLAVDTDEGLPAAVTLRFLTRRTLEVKLDPPDAATVGAFGGAV